MMKFRAYICWCGNRLVVPTDTRMAHWETNRWRCPLVIEAWNITALDNSSFKVSNGFKRLPPKLTLPQKQGPRQKSVHGRSSYNTIWRRNYLII